jgi:hypothetical protein
MSGHLCADGVKRFGLGQWQGYLSDAAGDHDEAARRLAEVPDSLRPLVESHWRSTRVLHWVGRVLDCAALDARRAMLQQCPADLRDDVRDQVALLFGLRAKARGTAR